MMFPLYDVTLHNDTLVTTLIILGIVALALWILAFVIGRWPR